MSIESWLLGALGLSHLVHAGDVFADIVNTVKKTETSVESAISAGTAAAATLEGIAANPTNIANDLAGVPNLIADAKAGLSAASAIVTTLKAAVPATKAASVSVTTTAPITVTHPTTGQSVTVPVGSTITVPVAPVVQSAPALEVEPTTGLTFPDATQSVDTSGGASDPATPLTSPDLVGDTPEL